VRLFGRLPRAFLPAGGKVVQLEAFERGRWRVFKSVRTGKGGLFRTSYRFGAATRGTFPIASAWCARRRTRSSRRPPSASSCASPDADLRVRDDVGMGQPETAVSDERAPVVRIDVLETFVELLTRSEDDGSSDAFYSSLCEAVCRLTSMDRAVIFRYDEARRRVRAAGAYGLDLDRFTNSHVTVESAPIARQALVEDRVIEMDAEAVAR
jgi:hypothetical protein